MTRPPPTSPLFPYTTLFRSRRVGWRPSHSRGTVPHASDREPFEHLLKMAEDAGSSDPRHQDRSRSEEHTSELQSRRDLVCRLLLEKKNKNEHARRAASYRR